MTPGVWQVTRIGMNGDLEDVPGESPILLDVQSSGALSVWTGCTAFTAALSTGDGTFQVQEIAKVDLPCDQAAVQARDAALFAAIAATEEMSTNEDEITIRDASGEALLTLRSAAQSAVATGVELLDETESTLAETQRILDGTRQTLNEADRVLNQTTQTLARTDQLLDTVEAVGQSIQGSLGSTRSALIRKIALASRGDASRDRQVERTLKRRVIRLERQLQQARRSIEQRIDDLAP